MLRPNKIQCFHIHLQGKSNPLLTTKKPLLKVKFLVNYVYCGVVLVKQHTKNSVPLLLIVVVIGVCVKLISYFHYHQQHNQTLSLWLSHPHHCHHQKNSSNIFSAPSLEILQVSSGSCHMNEIVKLEMLPRKSR